MLKFKQFLENNDLEYSLDKAVLWYARLNDTSEVIKLVNQGAKITDDVFAEAWIWDNLKLIKLFLEKGFIPSNELKNKLNLNAFIVNDNEEAIKYLTDKGFKIKLTKHIDKDLFMTIIIKMFGQEWIFINYPEYIKYIKNPDSKLLNKYSHKLMANKFDLFGNKDGN